MRKICEIVLSSCLFNFLKMRLRILLLTLPWRSDSVPTRGATFRSASSKRLKSFPGGFFVLLPFLQEMETELLSPGKKVMEFKVYYRNPLPRSTTFLGKITESRKKERGDNLKGLLNKAIKQYSDQGVDPSTMFLLEG